MRKFSALFFMVLFICDKPQVRAGYFNLAAMWQGPKLIFTVTPSSSGTTGTALSTQPVVALANVKGTVITTMPKSITLAAYADSRCTTLASGTVTATTNPVATSSGTATFAGVTYSAAESIYLRASAQGVRSACWGPIAFSAGGVLQTIGQTGTPATGTNNSGAVSVNVPSGLEGGDLMVAMVSYRNSPTLTTPSGWTLIRTDSSTGTNKLTQALYYRVVSPPEPASYTFNASSNENGAGVIIGYSGVDNASPIDIDGGTPTNASGTITAPSVNATSATGRLIGFYGLATGLRDQPSV